MKYDYCDWDELDIPENARKAWKAAAGAYVSDRVLFVWERPDWDWANDIASRHTALYDMFNGGGVDSPIEQTMAGWLVWLDGEFLGLIDACHAPWFEDDYRWEKEELAFSVQQQVQVGAYRVDFMVLIRGPKGLRRIAVECDGHDYHDKTKEQAARDKKRDRDLLLAGVPVMRFTGSEIYRDCEACFAQVQQAVLMAANEVI